MAAFNHYGPDPKNHPDQKELSSILDNLQAGPNGDALFAMGTDGILRTLSLDQDVIDAISLPPRLIKAFLDRCPYDQLIEEMFRGADGTTVPETQWWNPDPSLLPPPLTAEEKALAKKNYEEHKEVIEENRRKMESGELKPCGVVIRSDHDISPK